MTRSTPRKAKILPVHREEAVALKTIYQDRVKVSQAAFGADSGVGTQGAVWQFLNAATPLNAEKAVAFATALNVPVRSFSPRLADEIEGLAVGVDLAPADPGSIHASVRMVDAKASAGRGALVLTAESGKDLMFRRDWLLKNASKPSDVLAFRVDGDSMVDLHIVHGAVVLANRNKREPVNRKLFIVWCDGELYVKQLIKSGDKWFARSHNKDKASEYPDIPLNGRDRIEGRVFWCGFEL